METDIKKLSLRLKLLPGCIPQKTYQVKPRHHNKNNYQSIEKLLLHQQPKELKTSLSFASLLALLLPNYEEPITKDVET